MSNTCSLSSCLSAYVCDPSNADSGTFFFYSKSAFLALFYCFTGTGRKKETRNKSGFEEIIILPCIKKKIYEKIALKSTLRFVHSYFTKSFVLRYYCDGQYRYSHYILSHSWALHYYIFSHHQKEVRRILPLPNSSHVVKHISLP